MRFIAVVALLATCSRVLADGDVPLIRQVNAAVGSIVAIENSLLAPLAPFGRKLQSLIPAVPSPDPNVIRGNAIGSIFYVAGGVYNPDLYRAAITGQRPSGRKLQNDLPIPTTTRRGADGLPDPYGFLPAANLVASALRGKFPTGRKLSSADEKLKWDAEAVHGALGFSRKLQQDQVLANSLGSIIYGGVQTANVVKETYGRRLMNQSPLPSVIDPERTGFLGTGSSTIQENAILSIVGEPALINNPLTVRQATLGFQQTSGRKLFAGLNEDVREDAAGSLVAGVNYDNVRKAIFGFNQGTEGRKLLAGFNEDVRVDAAGSLIAGDIDYDNVRKAIFGFDQTKDKKHL